MLIWGRVSTVAPKPSVLQEASERAPRSQALGEPEVGGAKAEGAAASRVPPEKGRLM